MDVEIVVDGRTFYLYKKPRTYKSGRKGFYVWGKVFDAAGKRYQVICQIVEIRK